MIPKNKNKNIIRPPRHGFTLVELMIVVAIIGILAAIAIPAFLRYINSSRVSESELLMDWITKGAIAYYSSEQKFSGPNGDQPWHVGNPTARQSDSYGMPVPASSFPGKDYQFNTDEGEGVFANCAVAPSGGSKSAGEMSNRTPMLEAVVRKLKLSDPGHMYFQYAYRSVGSANVATVDVAATSNFKTGPPCHTQVRTITIVDNAPMASPIVLTNEFE